MLQLALQRALSAQRLFELHRHRSLDVPSHRIGPRCTALDLAITTARELPVRDRGCRLSVFDPSGRLVAVWQDPLHPWPVPKGVALFDLGSQRSVRWGGV